MALMKRPVPINFTKGLETKTDPFQIPVGSFLELSNSIFTTTGRLTKRNGFANLTKLPNTDQTVITTLNDNLLTTGKDLLSYSADTNTWLDKGVVQPVQLSVQPLVRVSTSQTAPDTAISASGLVCLVYVDNGIAYYQISDSVTGEQIVSRTTLPSTATSPRAFVLGNYFVITFIRTVIATPTLQYVAIPVATPASPKPVATISADVKSLTTGYDAYSFSDTLYIAWSKTANAIGVTSVSNNLVVAAGTTIPASTGDLMSVTVDPGNTTIWVTYYDAGALQTHTAGFNAVFGNRITPTLVTNGSAIAEITSTASNNVLTVFAQGINFYTLLYTANNQIRSDLIFATTVAAPTTTGPGIVTPIGTILRSVGLASKAFTAADGTVYVLVEYGDTTQISPSDDSNQPSYFLIDSLGNIYMRLAYSNGGGYESSQVLPSVTIVDDHYLVPYLVTDFLTTVNKGTNLPSGTPTNAIYTQTGINLAMIGLNTSGQQSSEIAGALHLTGGQLWEYDGVRPVEHGFHVWPENIVPVAFTTSGSITPQQYFYQFTYEWTDNAGNLHRSAPSIPIGIEVLTAPVSFTGARTAGSPTLGSISSFTGLQVGQVITGTGIPAGTKIASINVGASTITMTANATSGTATVTTITPVTATSVALQVPTLRLTYKIAPNPVRIVGYRWSTAQQVYYQFTSITSPTINSTTIDNVVIVDTNSDAEILGNPILYTTGGVVENIAAPASSASALFSNRLFLIDAEDPNTLWFSKQVIQNVPVEMSDLLTLYVAPTIGAQGSTGPMKALGAMDDKLIIFKPDAIYYINGSGPDNTGANSNFSEPVFVTSSIGSSNPDSVVLTPNGLMFQSDKGIWLLGRDLSTKYIGDRVERYNDNVVMSAKVIPGTNQVRFILDNNLTLMYDYYFNEWAVHTNISAISSTLYQGKHTYLNIYGQVLQETEGMYTDGARPVLMSLTTGWINIAGLQGFERFYFANLLGTYYTPFKLNIGLSYDYNPSATHNVIVSPDNFTPNWGDEAVWGSGGPWGGVGNVFSCRVFPNKQKCQSFQVSIQEIYDSSLGVAPGQGLSLSGLALIVGVKKGYRTQKASRSFG